MDEDLEDSLLGILYADDLAQADADLAAGRTHLVDLDDVLAEIGEAGPEGPDSNRCSG